MEMTCRKHRKDIHVCVENIINTFRQEMIWVPRKDKPPHITVTCKQVDVILAHAAKVTYHQKNCPLKWEAVIYLHVSDLMCENCGCSFKNKVIEEARRLEIL